MPEEILHVRLLADEIGPRPATTDAEAQAADVIEELFRRRGLDVDRQEFVCPRTYSWAFVLYHLLTIAAAVASGILPVLAWPAFAVAALTAMLMWFDLDTRFGLSSVMPKGPSQNVIGRHVPKARRGERVRRVVIVAHYDAAKSSLAFSPGMVRNFELTFALMKWATFLVPVLILARALPIPMPAGLEQGLWYGAMAIAAYLLVPTLINVHRELAMPPVDGANDNASGVAAMLGVMERLVAEPEDEEVAHPIRLPVRRTEEAAYEAEVVPDGALLTYSPAHAPEAFDEGFADELWSGLTGPIAGQGSLMPREGDASLGGDADDADDAFAEPQRLPPNEPDDTAAEDGRRAKRRGLFGRGRGRGAAHADTDADAAPEEERRGVRDWLGVKRGFDAREEGRSIGSWDNFGGDDDDDEFGFKGGRAGYDALDDPDFASEEASRIRRRVTERADRDLTEKEIWFVATGAEEAGTWGMRSLLDYYADDLRDAVIINIDNVGSGNVSWVTEEGMARRYRCDRRLASAAKRVAREEELPVRPRVYRGLSTDATPALARGYKAMSVMAFDINGRLPNWHWKTDTTENVSEENLRVTAEFVAGLIRAL